MNTIILPATYHRLCWFCQQKCNNFISICNACENDIKKNRKKVKTIKNKVI
jgi:hypothetical protein